jgi:hypothetical protein
LHLQLSLHFIISLLLLFFLVILDFTFLVLSIPSIYELVNFLAHLLALLFSAGNRPLLLLADQIL